MRHTRLLSAFSVKAAFFILLTLSSVTFLQAQTVTFAQFFERNGTNDFVFSNNGTNATFQTIAGGTPIIFIYQNVAGLPAELQGPQNARLFLTATTTTPAFQSPGDPPRDVQRFSGTVTIQIIRDTPCSCGTGSRRNLLTALVTPDGTTQSSLAGDDLSDSAGYTASDTRQNVFYGSDFLGFFPTSQDNLGLSFSSIIPLFSIGAGGFLNSFTAAGTGTFASTPPPVFNPPTAAGVTLSGRVFTTYGTSASRALVTLTDQSGATFTASTNNMGYFRFADIPAGQTVVISVSGKNANYSPRVVNLIDNISDLDFYPEE